MAPRIAKVSSSLFSPSAHILPNPVFLQRPLGVRFVRRSKKWTYEKAQEYLLQLKSNSDVTSLFGKSSSSADPKTRQELNATAIPDTIWWLNRAGYSDRDLSRIRFIHVAGTKGKGSVCAYATSMLQQYGRVGTFMSPHLISARERIWLDGKPITQKVFLDAFFDLWIRFSAAAQKEGTPKEEARGPSTKPFFFRYLTIMALHVFLRRNIGTVVMECGIGGEYDSTNILPVGSVSSVVISQLGIDHVAMLGDTVEEIAWHKAGILKPGARGFTRALTSQPAVMDVLRSRATEKGAALLEVPDDAVERWGGVEGLLQGDFQKYNQALAVLAVKNHLGMDSDPATALQEIPDKMIKGLEEASIRGRCETINDGEITWLVDGAHTADSLEQVAKWLAKTISPDDSLMLIFNQQERDVAQLLTGFVRAVEKETGRTDVFSHAMFTRNEVNPAEDEEPDLSVQHIAAETMSTLAPGCETGVFKGSVYAATEARELAMQDPKRPKILVTGSFHLVGGLMPLLSVADLY